MKSYQPGIISMFADLMGYPSSDTNPLPQNISSQNNNSIANSQAYSGGVPGGYYNGYGGGGGEKTYKGISGSGRNVIINHALTRRNTRATLQDSPEARAIMESFANYGAGEGIKLEAAPIASILGISEEAARIWADDVETKFHLYCSDKNQSRNGNQSLYQEQRLYMLKQQRDNDIFTRLHYNDDPELQSPLQFQGLDPSQVRGDAFTFTAFPNGIVKDGIVRDERGRPVAYNIFVRQSDRTFKEVQVPARSKDRSRINMLHGFLPEYDGQDRGFSRFAHLIQDFQKLTDFKEAHIQKAINEASIWIATQNKQQTPSDIFKGLNLGQGAGPVAGGSISTPVPDPQSLTTAAESVSDICKLSPAPMLQPGLGIFSAQQGDEIKLFDGKTPNSQYEAFVNVFSTSLSASMGAPIEVVLKKFNQNYSASRATLLLFWRELEMWRSEMATDFLHPIYEMYLSEEIAAGRITAPGWSDPRLRAAWLNNSWVGAPVPDIDPARTSKARRENISLGVTNADRESRGLNGSSFSSNRRKITEEYGAAPPPPWIKNPGETSSGSANASAYADFISDIEDILDNKLEDMRGNN